MVPTKAKSRPLAPHLRITAFVAVALVLWLVVLSGSPELHARFHAWGRTGKAVAANAAQGRDSAPANKGTPTPVTPDNDGGCAVYLFAQGALPWTPAVVVDLPPQTDRVVDWSAPVVFYSKPDHAHPPALAPPAGPGRATA